MKKSARIVVRNLTDGSIVCEEGCLAESSLSRMVGLLGKRSLPEQAGLLIEPSSGVHTFWMSFAIDIVALDKQKQVIGLWQDVGPRRIKGLSLKTKSVLELPSGRIARCGLSVGDRIAVERIA